MHRLQRVLRRRWLVGGCLLGLALAALAASVAVGHVERRIESRGQRFYETGKAAVELLGRLAGALRSRDERGIAAAYAPDFEGSPLGLDRPVLAGERDGVVTWRFEAPPGVVRRDGAVDGWLDYLAGLESVDAIGLHLERLESWGPEPVATVRFELLGTPRGVTRSGVDRALFRARFARSGDGLRIQGLELVKGARTWSAEPHFASVGARAGIAFENRVYPRFLTEPLRFRMIRYGPAGISAADYDGDGLYDLFVPDGVESRLLRNRGDGTFEDVTAAAGLAGLSGVSVGLFADYDNDGHEDLFVSRTFEPNQLFHGDGDGTFTDVTAQAGLGADCCTTVASWGDVDNDGDLDLYVGRYLDPRRSIPTTFYARNGEPNRLYRNDGDGTFTDVTDAAGVGDPGLCLGSAFGDYDDDGWPDLYVVNDFGRNTLYHNRGDGTFDDVSVATGTLAYGAGMSASFGDYDNDGRLDLYVANIRSDHDWFAEAPTVWRYMLSSFRLGVWRTDLPLYWQIFRQSGGHFVRVFRQMASGNTLLRNRGPADGGARFEDVTREAGVNPPGWFWGTSFADFDNDGWLDLYAADGWVYGARGTEIELDFLNSVVSRQDLYKRGVLFDPEYFRGRSWHGWERNRYLRNDRDGTFTEIGHAVGADLLVNSRGVAVADFWNRGVEDIAVAASEDRHALLANLGTPGRHWLEVEVAGGAGRLADGTNRDGVGVRLTVDAGGLSQVREVVLGDGYGSENSLRQHFGLGGASRIDALTVRWPRSGRVQTFRDVPVDRIVRVVEGSDRLELPAYPTARAPVPAASLLTSAGAAAPPGGPSATIDQATQPSSDGGEA